MNTTIKNAANAITVGTLSPSFIVGVLNAYREKFGPTITKITHGLGMGAIMADFHAELHDVELNESGTDDGLAKIYEKFKTAMFVDKNGNMVMPGFTVGIADRVNKRDLFVMVGLTGENVVLYQKTEDDSSITKIAALADPLSIRGLRIQSDWKDGNAHDRVMLSNLFGFDYDKADDEVLVPEGRVESSITLSRQIADKMITVFKHQNS